MIYTASMDELLEHSLKDYHVRGFDYVCLRRSDNLTIKAYLFDGDVSKAAEVVSPHDHRYDFRTICLAGQVTNFTFREDRFSSRAETYRRFAYRTPLNGGDGFEEVGEARLVRGAAAHYKAGTGYFMRHSDLHTIQAADSQTAIMLFQGADAVPVDKPTQTFMRQDAPDLSGLYGRFSEDEMVARIARLNQLAQANGQDVQFRIA